MLNMAVEKAQTAAGRSSERMRNLSRLLRYILVRGIVLLITVTIGIYLTIIIANGGGYVDDMRKAQIRESVSMQMQGNEAMRDMSKAERDAFYEREVALEIEKLGLDRPFWQRAHEYLWNGMTLNFGRADYLLSDSGSSEVRNILGERLFPTLLLMASGQLLLFFVSITFALFLSRRYGSPLDKLVVAMAPMSAAPAWFFGIFLILIFAAFLGWLPFGGLVSAPPPKEPLAYALSVLKHLILPVSAIVVSSVFLTSYHWRTFFLIYSSEDYVDMAKAKGLSSSQIERRYVLRPTLPTIITSFALTLISLWTGAIVLETVFNWPGIGRLTQEAINMFDTPVLVAVTVLYAYLLAITVFLLDIIYAIVDPRVKLGAEGNRS
jgi:peptide/nickel transport system permease protein